MKPSLRAAAAVGVLVAVAASIHYLRTSAHPARAKPVVEQTGGGSFRFFDTNCTFSHQSHDDPLKFPGQPGLAHLHLFFCNQSTDAFSTGDTLLAANTPPVLDGSKTTSFPVGITNQADGRSCVVYNADGTCPANREADGSAEWFPAVYDCGTTDPGPSPPLADCALIPPQATHTYYEARQPVNDPAVTEPPTGFAEIQGAYKTDNSGQLCDATDPASCGHEWRCLGGGDSNTYENIDSNAVQGGDGTGGFVCNDPADPANGKSVIRVTIHLAECWDGVHKFDINEQHVAYAQNKQCPAGFPVLLPAIEMQNDYTVKTGGEGHYYRLAVTPDALGSTSSAHGDYVWAWGPSVANPDVNEGAALIRDCLNVGQSSIEPGCNVGGTPNF